MEKRGEERGEGCWEGAYKARVGKGVGVVRVGGEDVLGVRVGGEGWE